MTEPRYPYVHVDVPEEESEDVSVELWELGAAGVEERDQTTLAKAGAGRVTLVASFEDDASAAEAVEALSDRYEAHVEHVVGDAWRDEWRKYFKPTRLGPRLVIRPSWEPYEKEPEDVVLVIDPGRAFGSGLHETTRLVLREIDSRIRGGERVLDVGCGSGILAVAALLLGAKDAVATDVDPEAVEVTRENAELNEVASRVEASTTAIEDVAGTWPFVVANIEARVLVPMAEALSARVAPGGTLVLSGILRGQEDDVAAAYSGFTRVETPVDGEWVALVLEKAR